MGRSTGACGCLMLLAVAAFMVVHTTESAIPFGANYGAITDETHTRVQAEGSHVDLVLDATSAAAFSSKGKYLFGSIGMGIKLVPGNSAGTVTAYYLSSVGHHHDEMDFEFLGNLPGQPYVLQTNVFAKGEGGREQRITLWFDPTADFHTYSLLWNKNIIIFFVDAVPVRAFRNNEELGVPFPKTQGMSIYASLWDGSSWATQGGQVPLDWSEAPFVASFQGFGVEACELFTGNHNQTNDVHNHLHDEDDDDSNSVCSTSQGNWWDTDLYKTLNVNQIGQLHNVRSKYLVYDYCTDTARGDAPVECARNWFE